MEDIYQLIQKRATSRSYKTDAIPQDVLDRVLDAGCKSPSGGGFQSLSIIKVTEPDKRRQLAKLCRNQSYIASAPVTLLICIDFNRMQQIMELEPAPFREAELFPNFWMGIWDAAICAQTMVLCSQQEGLGSCYNGNMLNCLDKVSQLFELPKLVCPAVMLSLGWPKVERRQPPKYPASLIVHDNAYQQRDSQLLYKAYRKQNNYQKMQPTEKKLEAIRAAAAAFNGEDHAAKVMADIRQKGYIGPYQFWFGCWYKDEPGFLDIAGYKEYFRRQGFGWLD